MINPKYSFPHYLTFDLGTCKFILFKINNKLQYCRTNCLALLRLIFISLAQWKLIISFIEPNEIQFFCQKIFYEWWRNETKYSFLLCKGQNLSIKSHPLNSYYKVLPWRLHKRISSVLHYNSIKILNGILFFTNLFCFGS